jgi:hypothetical protein
MTQQDTPKESVESTFEGDRYAGYESEPGYVVYDTENEAAWIESDTTLDPAERR